MFLANHHTECDGYYEIATVIDRPMLGLLRNARTTLKAMIHQAVTDQDINCRTVGRCVFGRSLDREIQDLIPRDDHGGEIPLEQDLGRSFLYARYDVTLSDEELEEIGVENVNVKDVIPMDSVRGVEQRTTIGKAVG